MCAADSESDCHWWFEELCFALIVTFSVNWTLTLSLSKNIVVVVQISQKTVALKKGIISLSQNVH